MAATCGNGYVFDKLLKKKGGGLLPSSTCSISVISVQFKTLLVLLVYVLD